MADKKITDYTEKVTIVDDDLLEIFEVEPIPAIGFGMGDISLRDFLEKHKLRPYA